MAKILYYTQNDQLPAPVVYMERRHPVTKKLQKVDLTDATAVVFRGKYQGGADTAWMNTGTIIDTTGGQVQLDFGAGNLATVGTIDVEVEIEWASGKKETYPSYLYLVVRAEHADPP